MVGIATPMQQALLREGRAGDVVGPSAHGGSVGGASVSNVSNALGRGALGRALGLGGFGIGQSYGPVGFAGPISASPRGFTGAPSDVDPMAALGYGPVSQPGYGGPGSVSHGVGGPDAGVSAGRANAGDPGFGTSGGGGSGSSGGGCFITTATVGQFGWSDDCLVLRTLRKFRDEIVYKMPNGKKDIEEYYQLAPSIARSMSEKDKAKAWRYIKKALSAIHRGKYLRAYRVYKGMVDDLSALQR